VGEESLANCWQRHQNNVEYLWESLEQIGLKIHVEKKYRLPTLTTVCISKGVGGKTMVRQLLLEHNIEVSGGLGELASKVSCLGLMGFNSCAESKAWIG
jgi:alanine-glyoxylate transaminase/serine-glyoxylate transaminase/serine-pyruvate transaminase